MLTNVRLCPSRPITQLAWRPRHGYLKANRVADADPVEILELAVASEDTSLRLFRVGFSAQ